MLPPHAGHGPAASQEATPVADPSRKTRKAKASTDSETLASVPLVRDERVELHPFDGHAFVLNEDRGERWQYVNSAWPSMVVTHFYWNAREGKRAVRLVPVEEGAFDFELSLRRGDEVISTAHVHIDCQ